MQNETMVRPSRNGRVTKDVFSKLDEVEAAARKAAREAAAAKRRQKEEAAAAAASLKKQKEEEEEVARRKQKEEKEAAVAARQKQQEEEEAAVEARQKQEEEEAAVAAKQKQEEEEEAAAARRKQQEEEEAAAAGTAALVAWGNTLTHLKRKQSAVSGGKDDSATSGKRAATSDIDEQARVQRRHDYHTLHRLLQEADATLYPGRTLDARRPLDGQLEDPRDRTLTLTRQVMGLWNRGATLDYLQRFIQQQVRQVLDRRLSPRPPHQPAASMYKKLEQDGWHTARSATTGVAYYWNEKLRVSQYEVPKC